MCLCVYLSLHLKHNPFTHFSCSSFSVRFLKFPLIPPPTGFSFGVSRRLPGVGRLGAKKVVIIMYEHPELLPLTLLSRLEIADIKKARGKAKVAGTIISLAGVTIITFYKGTTIRNLWGALIHIQGRTIHENQLIGSILAVASCVTWSMWYIMQAVTLKKYPAQLSLTAWMCLIGGAQSAVFAVLKEHKSEAWHIGFNIDLWNIIYSGAICSGLLIFIQLWCTEEKGPVFVAMFNPLASIMVALLAYFVFGERMYTGSILGGSIVIIGLYLLLWGKENDQGTS
ncbi:hypothetical protein KFK09_018639 [Dendrobium nobile]|uniref:WAT1-related protein n=1 Tax=Dendrobium nobile TaxID=94219 RepID=A0A8T3AWC2_DENNO|nr:hypothetical protein KFK09_018639 [Dendrobium nobile]